MIIALFATQRRGGPRAAVVGVEARLRGPRRRARSRSPSTSAHEYRLDSGDQLVDVYAQRARARRRAAERRHPLGRQGRGRRHHRRLRHSPAVRAASGVGAARVDRHRASRRSSACALVQREAYELALYAFKYVKGIDNVVAFLPPPPPRPAQDASSSKALESPSRRRAALGGGRGRPLPAMLFLPGDVDAVARAPAGRDVPGPSRRGPRRSPRRRSTLFGDVRPAARVQRVGGRRPDRRRASSCSTARRRPSGRRRRCGPP